MLNAKFNVSCAAAIDPDIISMFFQNSHKKHDPLPPRTISGINRLTYEKKREIIARLIPKELLERCRISENMRDEQGRDLIQLRGEPGSTDAELFLYHKIGFRDPVLYGHITDTISGQIHILLYNINNPDAERYDIDQLPDGTSTMLGTLARNIPEELRAMNAGLAPGQVRHGLRLLRSAEEQFEFFIKSLGQDLYFAEPLYYHNAILFERMGFAYQSGRRLMERIENGFAPDGDLTSKLDGSPFRSPEALDSVRLRSWAIHDGILGQPFSGVTMYKHVGKSAGISTLRNTHW